MYIVVTPSTIVVVECVFSFLWYILYIFVSYTSEIEATTM